MASLSPICSELGKLLCMVPDDHVHASPFTTKLRFSPRIRRGQVLNFATRVKNRAFLRWRGAHPQPKYRHVHAVAPLDSLRRGSIPSGRVEARLGIPPGAVWHRHGAAPYRVIARVRLHLGPPGWRLVSGFARSAGEGRAVSRNQRRSSRLPGWPPAAGALLRPRTGVLHRHAPFRQ